jgi:hypothetical protein
MHPTTPNMEVGSQQDDVRIFGCDLIGHLEVEDAHTDLGKDPSPASPTHQEQTKQRKSRPYS